MQRARVAYHCHDYGLGTDTRLDELLLGVEVHRHPTPTHLRSHLRENSRIGSHGVGREPAGAENRCYRNRQGLLLLFEDKLAGFNQVVGAVNVENLAHFMGPDIKTAQKQGALELAQAVDANGH